jgi:LysR family glycine cleavage system transcriptional activator
VTRRLPPLAALRAFEAAARLLSFKRAAAELAVTPTAISHQIRQLEQGLGTALFQRRTRQVVLTEAGRALHPDLVRAFDLMGQAVDKARRGPRRQVATLSATLAFTAKLLVPRAAAFPLRNPGWDLRLHASDDPVDLGGGEADAAIRYGLGRYPGLATLPLITDCFAPMASPRLGPLTPADLQRLSLIHFEWGAQATKISVPTWRAWIERAAAAGFDVAGLDPEGGITFNDENSAIQAAIAGQGVALLSTALVAAELKAGLLMRPFGPALDGLRFDFVHAAGQEDRPAILALRRWIVEDVAPFLPVGKSGEGND